MTQISVTPSPRYTFQRNSLYYFRYTLPPDISKVVGKQGLRYSLKTGYIKQAERKARRLAGTVEEFISGVREERLIIVKLSETQIQSLLDQHLRQSLNEDEERHLSAGPINPDDLDDELEAISYIKSDFKEALALNDYEGISSHVDDLLKELKVKPDKKSKNYKKLCRELLKVNIRILDITEKRTVGDHSDQFSTSTFSNSSKAEQKDQPKLSKIILKFVSEFMKADRWTEKTKSENEAVFDLFIKISGDVPINQYDHQAIRQYKETLGKLPANRNKIEKYRDKTIDKIISMPDVKPMAVNSVNKNIRRLSQLFPELPRQRDGYSQTPSKWFGKFKIKVGITSQFKVFHSFRHTVANTLKQADVPRDQAAEILGHDRGKDVTYGRYGKSSEAKRQLEVIKKLDFS